MLSLESCQFQGAVRGALADQNVSWSQVSMGDAFLVSVVQGSQYSLDDSSHVILLELAVSLLNPLEESLLIGDMLYHHVIHFEIA